MLGYSSLVVARAVPAVSPFRLFFFFNDTATTEIYTLSLHDALPISLAFFFAEACFNFCATGLADFLGCFERSEEHTSELQSRRDLVCRLLLEKKKKNTTTMDRLHINHSVRRLLTPMCLSTTLPPLCF